MNKALILYVLIGISVSSVRSSSPPANTVRDSTVDAFVRLRSYVQSLPALTHKIPPLLAQDGNLTVNLSYNPAQILYVDEVTQAVAVSSFIVLSWQDDTLRWNPHDFEGIDKVILKPDDIWTPLIYLLNSADSTEDVVRLPDPDTIELYANGNLLAFLAQKIVSSCFFDVTFFPFDEQNCSLMFQPLGSGARIAMQTVSFNLPLLELFSTHSSWTITDTSQSVVIWENELQRGTNVVKVTLAIKRRSTFFVINIITPIIVTSLMTLLVFWIPPASGEKITFLVTMFVSTTVFLNLVSNMMPRSFSSLPRFNLFLAILVSENLLTFLATSLVLRCYRAEQTEEKARRDREKYRPSDSRALMAGGSVPQSRRSSERRKLDSEGVATLSDPLTPSPTPHDVSEDGNLSVGSRVSLVPNLVATNRSWSSKRLDKIFFFVFLCITLALYCLLFM